MPDQEHAPAPPAGRPRGPMVDLDPSGQVTGKEPDRAVRQFLKQGTGGSVLNMSSVLGYSPSPKHFATHAYSAAKSAIIGMTRSAASYYAPHDIRFNVIAPALVETPMSRRAAGDESIQKFVATKQPLDSGRIGRPEDADAAAVYFLSDQSRFVTGQVLAVDGGWGVTEGQYAD